MGLWLTDLGGAKFEIVCLAPRSLGLNCRRLRANDIRGSADLSVRALASGEQFDWYRGLFSSAVASSKLLKFRVGAKHEEMFSHNPVSFTGVHVRTKPAWASFDFGKS